MKEWQKSGNMKLLHSFINHWNEWNLVICKFPCKCILSVLKWANSQVQLTIKYSDQQNTAFVITMTVNMLYPKIRLLHVSLYLQVICVNDNHEITWQYNIKYNYKCNENSTEFLLLSINHFYLSPVHALCLIRCS
jgi:hypothetical protein